ncbi:hypothetical protein EV360DRAFT_89571 [Lentinula raphanica]|nr:hypothetical protein EV360DRAFT_89571 [Lentinula raphanica]
MAQLTDEEHSKLPPSVHSERVEEAFNAYQVIATDRARCSLETEVAIGELRHDIAKTLLATVLEDPQLVWTLIIPAGEKAFMLGRDLCLDVCSGPHVSSRSAKSSSIFRQLANPSLVAMYSSGDDCANRLTGMLSFFFPHVELPVWKHTVNNVVSRGKTQAVSAGPPTSHRCIASKSVFPERCPLTAFIPDFTPPQGDDRNTSVFQLLDHYRSGVILSHARTMRVIEGIQERMRGHKVDEDAKSNALESHIEEFNGMFDALHSDWDVAGRKCPTITGFSDSSDGSVALDFWLRTSCLSALWELGCRLLYLGHMSNSEGNVEANKTYRDLVAFRTRPPAAESDWAIGSDWEDHNLYTRLLDHVDQLLIENHSEISGTSAPLTWAEEANLLSLSISELATVDQVEYGDVNENSVIEALLAEDSNSDFSNPETSLLVEEAQLELPKLDNLTPKAEEADLSSLSMLQLVTDDHLPLQVECENIKETSVRGDLLLDSPYSQLRL